MVPVDWTLEKWRIVLCFWLSIERSCRSFQPDPSSSHSLVRYLERRGTMRTAFEFARLLLALDPWNDPHCALMHMDFLVVKAEQYDWFLEMEEAWEDVRKEMPSLMPLSARPGWRWSRALVLRGLSVKKGGGEVCTEI
jgi:hypothetical protein